MILRTHSTVTGQRVILCRDHARALCALRNAIRNVLRPVTSQCYGPGGAW